MPILGAAAQARGQEDPAAPVERLHEALTRAAGAESPRARFEQLLPVVREVFDFATMSRVAVGSAWADFSAEEQAAVVERFAAYAAANYASNFDNPDVSFRTVEVGDADGGRLQVMTELVRPNGEAVVFDYLVQRTDAGPRIINVVVDGTMNELARRRGEFRALLQAGGLPRLLEALEARRNDLLG